MSYYILIDDLPFIAGSELREFKSQEEVAAKLMILAMKFPKAHLDFKELPANSSLKNNWFATGARKGNRVVTTNDQTVSADI